MNNKHIYQQLTAIIFVAALFAQTFSKSFVIVDYYANTSKYAQNCVNKAKPKMQCKGKCQMMKKLQEEEKKDQQSPERKAENKYEVLLSSKSFFTTPVLPVKYLASEAKYPNRSNSHAIDRSYDIFHPPQA